MDNEEKDRTGGESPHPNMTRSGEDVSDSESEAGREATGHKGPTARPTGTSTARDYTGIDPQEPKDGGSPAG